MSEIVAIPAIQESHETLAAATATTTTEDRPVEAITDVHPADQAAATIRQHLENIFTAAAPHLSAESSAQRRAQYQERLKSFTTIGYFAQPIQLSPILCALTGWKLQPKNEEASSSTSLSVSLGDSSATLSCPSCHAQLELWIPSILTPRAQADLVQQYQPLLWKSHRRHCPHKKEAEYFIQHQMASSSSSSKSSSSSSSLVVPTMLARAIPSSTPDSSLDLVEQDRPGAMFRRKWQRFYPHVLAAATTEMPLSLDLPRAVLEYQNATGAASSLLTRLVDQIQSSNEDDEGGGDGPPDACLDPDHQPNTRDAAEAAAALVLLGWDLTFLNTTSSSSSPPRDGVPAIHCLFCLSQHALTATEPSLHKRPRPGDSDAGHHFSLWHQPWAAHRYYCPWVAKAGTLVARPLWEVLADRLLQSTNHDGDEEMRLRQRIRAGVSPVRFPGRK